MNKKLDFGIKLSREELKKLTGGEKCGYGSATGNDVTCIKFGGAAAAEFMAGDDGWWCCNCAAVANC